MKKYFLNILTFLFYFIYLDIAIILVNYLGFDYNSISLNKRIIFVLICNIIFMLYLLIVYIKELKTDAKDFKKNFKKYVSKYFIYYVNGVILMAILNIIIQLITGLKLGGNESTLRDYIHRIPLYMFFSTAIYAPFVEEMIFRKSIRNLVKNDNLFIVLSGFIFGVLHITNFSNIKEIIMGIPYIVMGIDFALIYSRSKNIFTTMSFHMFHNLLLFLIIILFK